MAKACHIHGKGHQGGRHVNVIKRSGHTVFAPDGGQTKSKLSLISPAKSGKRLAPPGRLFGHPPEVLLERKPDLPKIAAGSHDLGH